MPEFSLIFASP